MQELRAIVSGIVQGVMYRAFTKSEAVRLGICGYVKNVPNGTVEVLGQGSRETLESFVALLEKGPTHARVSAVQVTWGEAREIFTEFIIRA
ncbi:MAG: hypothetical protein RIQ56_810 [Candidatus Parcubacteria bacterium]|jgi:acylphosphatase